VNLLVMKRCVPPVIVAATLVLLLVVPVKAHANLIRSVPDAGAVLVEAPPEIVLEFSEELDPAVAKVEIWDASGQVVIPGPGVVDPDTPRILRLRIDTLPDGTYSAIWRVRSAVDGHITNSSLGFSIGEASSPASLLPAPGTPDPATVLPSTAQVIARWISYLAAAISFGSLSFGLLVWRPAYRRDPNRSEAINEVIRRLIQRIALSGLGAMAIATLGFAIILVAEASEVPLWRALGTPLSQLFAGRIGWVLGARLILTVILGWLVLRLPSPATGSSTSSWVILLLGGLLLLTFSMQGHGAARSSVISVIVIWLHLTGTAIWLGGLPILFLALRQDGIAASTLVPRFSAAALVSVAMIAATGLYNAFVYVGTVEALTSTTYGGALIAKTVIFALLLALGAVNLLVLSPRLQKTGAPARNGLTRTIPTEIVLGILLLLAVGVLSGVSPAFDALEAHKQQGIIETARVDDVNMLLRVVPGEGGENEIGVEFTDSRPGANAVVPQVLLRLTATMMGMGTQQVETTSVDGLRYTARGSFFSMTGPWELEVIIRRPGFNDVRQTFEIEIKNSPSP
jgi:copper transport protein